MCPYRKGSPAAVTDQEKWSRDKGLEVVGKLVRLKMSVIGTALVYEGHACGLRFLIHFDFFLATVPLSIEQRI